MDNCKLIIKDEELFTLFLKKVPYNWKALDYSLRHDNTHDHVCLYKESVQVIRLVEKFMDDLRTGLLPQVPELGLDPTLLFEPAPLFLSYFKQFKFEPNMFDMTCLELGLNWTYFQKFLEVDAVNQASNTFGLEKGLSNSRVSLQSQQQRSPLKIHVAEAKKLINYFSDLQKNHLYIKEKDKQDQQVAHKINNAFSDFDRLLSLHQEVYILVIDIRFVRITNQAESQSLEQLIEKVLEDRAGIQKVIFQFIPDLLRAYTKLEHDYQNGLKLSCVFILRHLKIDKEDEVAAYLQTLLRQNFRDYDAIDVINGNRFVRKHAKKSAVGRVGIDQSNRVEQFKYWVLSYFFKMDSFAKLIHPKITFEVNEYYVNHNWQQPEIRKQVVSSKKIPPPKNLAQVLQEWKAPKGMWDIKHLSKRVADRLLVGQIYHKEFCAEQGFPALYGEWLFQIEVFIETLLHNQYPAFNEVRSSHQTNFLNAKDIQTSATQLGQQYLSLMKLVVSDRNSSVYIDNLIQNCGLRMWWFGHEDNLRLWGDFQNIFNDLVFDKPVDSAVLGQLNRNIEVIRSLFLSKQSLAIAKRELWEKQYAQCVRRQRDTREYLNCVLEQNCWAYRITVEARSSKGSLKQSEFSKLFTKFMRFAKRAQPCYWLRGYVGIWQEIEIRKMPEFRLDVILFFNDRCQEQVSEVVQTLNERWNNFLDTKAVKTLNLQDVENITYEGSIEPKILMRSIDELNTQRKAQNTYHVCIEASDRKMKKMVIEHVIPYFAYRDVFQAQLSQKVPKAFIKGVMLKK